MAHYLKGANSVYALRGEISNVRQDGQAIAKLHVTGIEQFLQNPTLYAQRAEPNIRPLGSLPEC